MSDLATRLADGEVVCGAGASTFAPAVVEVYGSLGLDYVWLDLEHKGPSPADGQQLEHLVRAAEGADLELLVRLPNAEPWLIRKALDAGVSNLLLARVETPDEVRRAARATTVSYDGDAGERGVGISHSSDWGTGGYEPGNDAAGLGVMVETPAAVESIEDILAVPGLDFVYPGAADLAVGLGHPFTPEAPLVRDALDTVTAACLDAGMPLGRTVTAPADVPGAVGDGCRLLRFGDELDAVRERQRGFLDALGSDSTQE